MTSYSQADKETVRQYGRYMLALPAWRSVFFPVPVASWMSEDVSDIARVQNGNRIVEVGAYQPVKAVFSG
ncbi:MAG: hypothetical protein ACI8WM_001164 [Burkholderiaceae bacterium]|jgi:hypothetical protein